MSEYEIGRLARSTVAYLAARRHEIDMEPPYQRQGAVWSVTQQQLLIDSLINGFDVPKCYLHQFVSPKVVGGVKIRYALVDGKQRLEAIFDFLDNAFPLSDDFKVFDDPSVQAGGLTYRELAMTQPEIVSILNATALDIVTIRTDDIELIEEMFSRLNEAVPLNAAEKRNAYGGPLPGAVRDLSVDAFFVERLPFNNTRYRHFDLAAKFLYWEQQTAADPGVRAVKDVKKYRLDRFFRDMKAVQNGSEQVASALTSCGEVLANLTQVFTKNDPMLSSVGMVSLYYLLALRRRHARQEFPNRSYFSDFNAAKSLNKRAPDEDTLVPGQYQLLEFDRLAQSPNDGGALTFRLGVLDAYVAAKEQGDDPLAAVAKVGLEEADDGEEPRGEKD